MPVARPDLRPDHLGRPHPDRFSGSHPRFAEVMARHAGAVTAGSPTYRDPISGYQVFTSASLAARDRCCESGCRHCPFLGAPGECDGCAGSAEGAR